MTVRAVALPVVALLAAAPVMAAPCWTDDEPVSVVRWQAPLTALLEDGRSVRLVDVAPADWLGVPAAPADLPTGPARLRPAALEPDRYGRTLGDVVMDDTAPTLRAALVADGLALVDGADMPVACLDDVWQAERSAERARRGLWSTTPVRRAAEVEQVPEDAIGRYALVEGQVDSVGETRRTIYLNFGENFRTDFTVLVPRSSMAAASAVDLAGHRVRVRGVLDQWQGGMIRVDHPAQLERLAAPEGSAPD